MLKTAWGPISKDRRQTWRVCRVLSSLADLPENTGEDALFLLCPRVQPLDYVNRKSKLTSVKAVESVDTSYTRVTAQDIFGDYSRGVVG